MTWLAFRLNKIRVIRPAVIFVFQELSASEA